MCVCVCVFSVVCMYARDCVCFISTLHVGVSKCNVYTVSILCGNRLCIFFVQVKVRLRKALERNSVLEDELMLANQEVCDVLLSTN